MTCHYSFSINPGLQLSSNVDSAQPSAPFHSDTDTSFFSVELQVSLMNNTLVVRTNDHLIVGIVVQAFDIVINVVRFCDVSTEFLTDQLTAVLTAIPVEKFEILSNFPVQLPYPCHPLIDNETCIDIDKIIVKVRFNTALLLVFDQFPEFLQIARNDRFQNIAVIVLCRINREVLL